MIEGHFSNTTNTNEKIFTGLNLIDKYGSVKFPEGAKDSNLGKGIVQKTFKTASGKIFEFYINKDILNNILLEVNNANLFRITQGRFMVIAKVKNIHVPFYISSSGTDGKNKGTWYPFFGFNGAWLVKGNVSEDGEMKYHPEITKVQEILNENLKFPASFISPKGKFGGGPKDANGVEPLNAAFDLNDHFQYQNQFFSDEKDINYTKRITGYNPERVVNDEEESSEKWISDIISEIE